MGAVTRHHAIVLLGPTGSGKTPLGDFLEAQGLHGRRCAHFDFGARLRMIAETGVVPRGLTEGDVDFIHRVLRAGALLENERFSIARAILEWFAEEKSLGDDDFVVLNGLPRHRGQAADVDALVDVRVVVVLECAPETVRERIRLDSGGDRAERTDDSIAEIEKKLATFQARTLPLIEHYRARGARIERIKVGPDTAAERLHALLSAGRRES